MEPSRFMYLSADPLFLNEDAIDIYSPNLQQKAKQEYLPSKSQLAAPELSIEPATPFNPDFVLGGRQEVPGSAIEDSLRVMSRSSTYADSLYSMNGANISEQDLDSIARTPSPTLSRTDSIAPNSSPASSKRVRRSRATKASSVVEENFIKRPLNSFMLYRKDKQHDVPTNNHQSISRIIGDMWRKESAEVKARYDQLAREERERHALQYPGYKFQPRPQKSKDKGKEKRGDRPQLKSTLSQNSMNFDSTSQGNSFASQLDNLSSYECQPSSTMPRPHHVSKHDSNYSYYMRDKQHVDSEYTTPLPLEFAHYGARVDCFSEDPYALANNNFSHFLTHVQAPNTTSTQADYPAWQSYQKLPPNVPAGTPENCLKNFSFCDAPIYQRVSQMDPLYTKEQVGDAAEPIHGTEDFYQYQFRCHDTGTDYVPSLTKGLWEMETIFPARHY